MMFDNVGDVPEIDLSEVRVSQMLGDIKRNSRNRRIAMFAPVVLAAAVLGAMVAAPPQHGGLALVADAETPDPQLPRVFGSNGVWRLAEPIEDAPSANPGPADMIEAPTEPAAPFFALAPPDPSDLQSLPTSTSTPPAPTSGQSPDPNDISPVEAAPAEASAAPVGVVDEDPAPLDQSSFSATIKIEPPDTADDVPADDVAAAEQDVVAELDPATEQEARTNQDLAPANQDLTPEETTNTPDPLSDDLATTPDASADGDVTVAVEEPQTEHTQDHPEANPSTPTDEPTDAEGQARSVPVTIVPQSVLVYSAHVSVAVQVVDVDSSVIDWCNTRVDWGDGSVSRVAGADDADLCTASCEHESMSSVASENASSAGASTDASATGINQIIEFEHLYADTIDASPRVFVATGDGCNYTLAELQLAPFTVVPLP